MKCRFTPFNLSPDVCRPGVWCDELDHSLGCGSFLLRRSQRLHPGLLQVSDYFFLPSLHPRVISTHCHVTHRRFVAYFFVSRKGCSSWAPERATCPTTCAWSISTATPPSPPCSSTSVNPHHLLFPRLSTKSLHVSQSDLLTFLACVCRASWLWYTCVWKTSSGWSTTTASATGSLLVCPFWGKCICAGSSRTERDHWR